MSRHPFVGLFAHRLRRDATGNEEVHWQGRVKEVGEGTARIQLFSWATGDATDVISVPVSELSDGMWRLFPDQASWRQAAAASSERAKW